MKMGTPDATASASDSDGRAGTSTSRAPWASRTRAPAEVSSAASSSTSRTRAPSASSARLRSLPARGSPVRRAEGLAVRDEQREHGPGRAVPQDDEASRALWQRQHRRHLQLDAAVPARGTRRLRGGRRERDGDRCGNRERQRNSSGGRHLGGSSVARGSTPRSMWSPPRVRGQRTWGALPLARGASERPAAHAEHGRGPPVLRAERRRAPALHVARRRANVEPVDFALLDSVPDAMVIADVGGGIVHANAEAERLFGWTREELVGRPIEVLLPGAVPRRCTRLIAPGTTRAPRTRPMGLGLDLSGLRKDGAEFAAEIGLSPIDGRRAAVRGCGGARRLRAEAPRGPRPAVEQGAGRGSRARRVPLHRLARAANARHGAAAPAAAPAPARRRSARERGASRACSSRASRRSSARRGGSRSS